MRGIIWKAKFCGANLGDKKNWKGGGRSKILEEKFGEQKFLEAYFGQQILLEENMKSKILGSYIFGDENFRSNNLGRKIFGRQYLGGIKKNWVAKIKGVIFWEQIFSGKSFGEQKFGKDF